MDFLQGGLLGKYKSFNQDSQYRLSSNVNFYRIYILLSDYCFDEVWVQPRATSYDEKSIRCLVKIIDD